jgi:hypothetical protein
MSNTNIDIIKDYSKGLFQEEEVLLYQGIHYDQDICKNLKN